MNGNLFAEMILRHENFNIPSQIVILEDKGDHSRTVFNEHGQSKIYLGRSVYQGSDINAIMVAAHECGHFLNNKRSLRWYNTFNKSRYLYLMNLVLVLLMIISLIIIAMEKLEIALWGLIVIPLYSPISVYISRRYSKMYRQDERMAEVTSRYMIRKYFRGFCNLYPNLQYQLLKSSMRSEMSERKRAIVNASSIWMFINSIMLVVVAVMALGVVVMLAKGG